MNKHFVAAVLVAGALLVGCAKEPAPSIYGTSEVGVVTTVKPGIIVSHRLIKLDKNRPADADPTLAQTPNAFQSNGYEYVIQLEDGSVISLIQTEQVKFKDNQRVFVIYGKTTRIVANNT